MQSACCNLFSFAVLIIISGGSIPNPSNKWAEGEPNNYRGDQDCLAIQKESDKYLYDDDYCSKRQPIRCQFVLN